VASRELELTRVKGERRLYALAGVGTLRLAGLAGRSATAQADGRTWQLRKRGLVRPRIEASEAGGSIVGEFVPRAVRRGGPLTWSGRELALRPASHWRERYALAEGDHELAVFEGKSAGRRPVRIAVGERGSIEAGLLLFAAFVVRGLVEDADAAATTTAAAGA
jgi:hypothetical protein